MKHCSKCGIEKPLTEYARASKERDGRKAPCKVCCANYNQRYREANRDHLLAYNKAWNEAHPEAMLAASRRYRERITGKPVGERVKIYESVAAQKRAWRLANPDKVREHKRVHHERHREQIVARVQAWRQANPMKQRAAHLKRRSAEKNAPGVGYTTAEMIAARVSFYGDKCVYCGSPWEAIDHRIPLARGGSHWPANLVPACSSCNSQKHAKTEREFRLLTAQ